jgi:hypothetical protein
MKPRPNNKWQPAASAGIKLCLTAVLFQAALEAVAQPAIRNVVEAEAATQLRPLNLEAMPYTFKSGDFRMLMTPSMEADWNNNINLSRTNQLQDYILRPMMMMNLSYPLTQVNLLRLDVGAGYDDYLQHHNYSNWRVNSGSQLSLDTYVKDVLINVHDRFYYYQDAGAQSAVAGTGQFGSDENVAGAMVAWNPKDLNLSVSYDHENIIPTGTPIESQDLASELVDTRAGWRFEPTATAGVEGTYSSTRYSQAILNNNSSYSIGGYGLWNPGTYFKMTPRAGYVIYDFQGTSTSSEVVPVPTTGTTVSNVPIRTSDVHSWYADLTLTHDITPAVSYSLSGGHQIELGVFSDVIDDYYARLGATWRVVKTMNVQGSFSFDHGRQGFGNISGSLQETYDWYTGSLLINRQLTRQLSVGLNSRLTYRSSTIYSLGYLQYLVGIQVAYAFQ